MPALPIARALIERGHSVRRYAGAAFADRTTDIGEAYRPMSSYDYSQNRAGRLLPRTRPQARPGQDPVRHRHRLRRRRPAPPDPAADRRDQRRSGAAQTYGEARHLPGLTRPTPALSPPQHHPASDYPRTDLPSHPALRRAAATAGRLGLAVTCLVAGAAWWPFGDPGQPGNHRGRRRPADPTGTGGVGRRGRTGRCGHRWARSGVDRPLDLHCPRRTLHPVRGTAPVRRGLRDQGGLRLGSCVPASTGCWPNTSSAKPRPGCSARWRWTSAKPL